MEAVWEERCVEKHERRESEGRGGGMWNAEVWEEWERHKDQVQKKRESAKAEVLSESEDRAREEKERCVLYAPRMRAKETRR